jgi:hypothetical protein
MDNSDYQANYQKMIVRLQSKELADFTLGAEANGIATKPNTELR